MMTNDNGNMPATGAPAGPVGTSAGAEARVGVAQRVVAVHRTYADAQATVDTLRDGGFPMPHTTIVGRGLRAVDRMTGQLSTPEVAGRGAISGALIGALVGSSLGLFDLMTPTVPTIWLAVNAAILGAVLGAVLGLLGYVATRGRRTVATDSDVQAERYDVQVDADLADRAVRLLHDVGPERAGGGQAATPR